MCRSYFACSPSFDRLRPSFRIWLVAVVTVRIESAVIFVPFEVLDQLAKIDPAVSAAHCWFTRVRLPQEGEEGSQQ
jgi:hypothetical protein